MANIQHRATDAGVRARSGVTAEFDGTLTPLLSAARFSRLENVLAIQELPNGSALNEQMTAALFGCDVPALGRLRLQLQAAITDACDQLLAEDQLAEAIAALPFAEGEVVAVVGDSITADRISWAEILAAVLGRVRPREVQVVNVAVSGGTTADMLARIDIIAGHHPSWVITMIGTNDVRRHGRDGTARMTSLRETERNLRVFSTIITRDMGAHLALITPPPIDEARVASCEQFTGSGITWRSADVDELAELVRRQPVPVVDVHQMLSALPTSSWLSVDGVHPSLEGQRQIARETVVSMAHCMSGSPGHGRAIRAERDDPGRDHH